MGTPLAYRISILILAAILLTTAWKPDARTTQKTAPASEISSSILGTTIRISVASDGSQGNGHSGGGSLSADGRFVAFQSEASNLVSGDTNNAVDVFVRDLQTGKTERVSVSSEGSQGNGGSHDTSISADGRFVTFPSTSTNLVSGDTNDFCLSGSNCSDIFVKDRQTGLIERVSVASDGSQANSYSLTSSISADGRYVAFISAASNLVSGDTNNFCDLDNDGDSTDNCLDVFVHDRQDGSTERVSIASDGSQGNYSSGDMFYGESISADGRFVAFFSRASNLVIDDMNNVCSFDGDYIYDDNCPDVFVHDIQTGSTTLASVASDGSQANGFSASPSISADGRYVAFWSGAVNLVSGDNNGFHDVFVHDMQTGSTELVSVSSEGEQGNAGSEGPVISASGRFVIFTSTASNLVWGDGNECYWSYPTCPDVFLHDRETGITERISIASNGDQGNFVSAAVGISANGRFVTFRSQASNLVVGDTNYAPDVFLRDREGIYFFELFFPITWFQHPESEPNP